MYSVLYGYSFSTDRHVSFFSLFFFFFASMCCLKFMTEKYIFHVIKSHNNLLTQKQTTQLLRTIFICGLINIRCPMVPISSSTTVYVWLNLNQFLTACVFIAHEHTIKDQCGSLVCLGQQWSSVTQKNNIHQTLTEHFYYDELIVGFVVFLPDFCLGFSPFVSNWRKLKTTQITFGPFRGAVCWSQSTSSSSHTGSQGNSIACCHRTIAPGNNTQCEVANESTRDEPQTSVWGVQTVHCKRRQDEVMY